MAAAAAATGVSAPRERMVAAVAARATIPATPASTLRMFDAASSTAHTPSMSLAASSYPDRPWPTLPRDSPYLSQDWASAIPDITPPTTAPIPGRAFPAMYFSPISVAWTPIATVSPIASPLENPVVSPPPT